MKRTFKIIALVLCMAVAVCSFMFRTNALTSGIYTYTVSSGKAKITAVDKSVSGDIEIPDKLDSYAVNVIGSSAFSSCSNIESVVLPDTIVSIEYGAFYRCSLLSSIIVGKNVLSVGCYAFEETAFYENKNNWENGVLYIGNILVKADEYTTPSYSVKDGTTVIADQAFLNCDSLDSIYLPVSISRIGDLSFYFCNSLTDVYYGGDSSTLKDLRIGENNSKLTESVWHYGGYMYLNTFTAGDINGDGEVNNVDVVRLLKYHTDWDVETVKRVLDVNGDGLLNNRDIARLLKYLSGWDVSIYPVNDGSIPSIGGDQSSVIVF